MANNTNIKFHRVSTLPTSGYATGDLYFVNSKKTIYLRTDDGWEIYDSGISKLPVKPGTGSNSLLSNDLDWSEATGEYSYAQGCSTTASGQCTHAEGYNTNAKGVYSHTEGYGTITNNRNEHAEGGFNLSTEGVTQYSIGIGTSDTARKNAIEVTSEGKEYVLGVGSYDGTNVTSATDVATVINNIQSSVTDEVTRATAAEKVNSDAIDLLNDEESVEGSVKYIAKQYADDAVAGSGGSSSGYNLFSVTYGGATGAIEYLSLREAIINGSPLYFGYSDAGIVSYNCSAVISNIGTDDESIIILLEDMYNMLGSIGSTDGETEIGVAGCYSQQGATFIFKKSDYSVTGGANLLPDSSMSSVSQNSVQNKVVKAYIDDALGDIKTILASI